MLQQQMDFGAFDCGRIIDISQKNDVGEAFGQGADRGCEAVSRKGELLAVFCIFSVNILILLLYRNRFGGI